MVGVMGATMKLRIYRIVGGVKGRYGRPMFTPLCRIVQRRCRMKVTYAAKVPIYYTTGGCGHRGLTYTETQTHAPI